jgi:hypothetical protein
MQTTTIELPNRFGRTSPEATAPLQPNGVRPGLPAGQPASGRPFAPPPVPVPQAYVDPSTGVETKVSYGPPPSLLAGGSPAAATRPLGAGIQAPGAQAGGPNTTVWNGAVGGLGQGISSLNQTAQPGMAGQTAMRPTQTQPSYPQPSFAQSGQAPPWSTTTPAAGTTAATAAPAGAGFQPPPAHFGPTRPRALRAPLERQGP